jgi:hypothetical protein
MEYHELHHETVPKEYEDWMVSEGIVYKNWRERFWENREKIHSDIV